MRYQRDTHSEFKRVLEKMKTGGLFALQISQGGHWAAVQIVGVNVQRAVEGKTTDFGRVTMVCGRNASRTLDH